MRLCLAFLIWMLAAPASAQDHLGHGMVVADRQDSQDDTREFGFGQSVLRYDDQLIVGAVDSVMSTTGEVIFHRRIDGVWVEFQRLAPSFDSDLRYSGYALARVGDYLIVGAPSGSVDGQSWAGEFQVLSYDVSTGTWVQAASVTEPTPAEAAFFGAALAVDGSMLYVGAPYTAIDNLDFAGSTTGALGGRVYAFEFDGVSPEPTLVATIQGQFDVGGSAFGQALVASPGRLVVGAPGEGTPTRTGAVYQFETAGATPTLVARVENESAAPEQGNFGRSLSMFGDRLMVGAATPRVEYVANPGAASLFEISPAGLTRLATLESAGAGQFGWSVLLLDETRVLVGAPGDGHVFHFIADGNEWTQVQRLAEPMQTTFWVMGFGETLTMTAGEIYIGNPSALHDMGMLPSFSKGGNLYEIPQVAGPLADLSVSASAPDSAAGDSTAEVSFSVTGDSARDLTAAYLVVRTELEVLSAPAGCTGIRPEILQCELGALAAGAMRNLTFTVRMPEYPPMLGSGFDAYVGSESPDPDTADNLLNGWIVVTEPPPPSSGGGAFGWFTALFLLAMLKSRLRLGRSPPCSARTSVSPDSTPNSQSRSSTRTSARKNTSS